MKITSSARVSLAKHKLALAVLLAVLLAVVAGHAFGEARRITEFRGYSLILNGLEDEIWRLGPDGRATMIYSRNGGRRECNEGGGCQGNDAGTWSRRDGRLCVDWQTRREVSGCYMIVPMFGIHVRLVGPHNFEGTLEEY